MKLKVFKAALEECFHSLYNFTNSLFVIIYYYLLLFVTHYCYYNLKYLKLFDDKLIYCSSKK
jgi:hypothetical protein